MTTIATDGKSMAGDGLCCDHCDVIIDTEHRKVHRLSDGSIVGSAGSSHDAKSWREWLEAGEAGDCPIDDNRFAGLILRTSGIVEWVDYKGRRYVTPTPAAVGSGQDLAYGAMGAGASPSHAVAIACERDVHSGGSITVEYLEEAA